MKRKMMAACMAAVMLAGTAGIVGCGGSSEGTAGTDEANLIQDDGSDVAAVVISTGSVYMYPDSIITEIGDYSAVELDASDYAVTDDDIQDEIDGILESYADFVEVDKDVVEEGDIVDIDFTGYVDGETFDGGSSEGYELEIGSGTFIDGFEDALIGAAVGETTTIEVTFPDDYSTEELAGVDAEFEVTVNAVIEYVEAEWTDEFVSGNLGYETTEEYEAVILEDLEGDMDDQKEYDAFEAIAAVSSFRISDTDVQALTDEQLETYETYASYYGMETGDFIYYFYGVDYDEFEDDLYNYAYFQIQCGLIIDVIAIREGLIPSDDEYDEAVQELADEYSDGDTEAFEEEYGYEVIMYSLIYDEVIEYVMGNVVLA